MGERFGPLCLPRCTAPFGESDAAFKLIKHMDTCWSLRNQASKYYTLERLVDNYAPETDDGTKGGIQCMNVHKTKNVQGGNAKGASFRSNVFPPAEASKASNFPNGDGDYICAACSAVFKTQGPFDEHTKTCWSLNNKTRRWDCRNGTYEVPKVSGFKHS